MKYGFAKNPETISQLVKFESNAMSIQILGDSIKRLTSKLSKLDDSKEDEKRIADGIRAEIESAKAEKSALEDANKAAQAERDAALAVITAEGNDEGNVIRVLRLLAASDNRRMLKYVVDSKTAEAATKELVKAMDTIHFSSEITEEGLYRIPSSEAAKKPKTEIDSVIRSLFHLPFESGLTKKVKPKVNSGDLHAIHESYIRGINGKVDKKSGLYTCELRASGAKVIEAIAQIVTSKL